MHGHDPRPGTASLSTTAYATIGMRLADATADGCNVSFEISDTARDATGACSLGAIALAAESAASTSAGIACGHDKRAFGAELDLAFLERPISGTVTAHAYPTSLTEDVHVWSIIVSCQGTIVASGRCTLMIVNA